MTDNPNDENRPKEPGALPNWLGVDFQNNSAGLQVFRVACLATLVFIIIVNFPGLGDGFQGYKALRSIEFLLAIAALGLIVSFLSNTSNVAALIFGFFVVAALIVPTRDIVRFALLATGSEKTVESYYGSSSVASNLSGRAPDIARNIAVAVERVLRNSSTSITSSQMDQITLAVQQEITSDRILTLIERVKARGVFELLSAVERGSTEEFLYRYADSDRLSGDLAFLRYEDLLSMVYDDVATVSITPLGRLVIQREGRLFETDDEDRVIIGDGDSWPFAFPCEAIPTDRDPESLQIDEAIAGVDVPSESLPMLLQLVILPGEIGPYSIHFDQVATLDPILSVYRIGTTDRFVDAMNSCQLVGSNDDYSQRDARLDLTFQPGRYLMRLDRLGDISGSARFSIRRAEEVLFLPATGTNEAAPDRDQQ